MRRAGRAGSAALGSSPSRFSSSRSTAAPVSASLAANALSSIAPVEPLSAVVGGVEGSFRRAEFAGDADQPVVAHHLLDLVRREAPQHGVDSLGRAAADRGE